MMFFYGSSLVLVVLFTCFTLTQQQGGKNIKNLKGLIKKILFNINLLPIHLILWAPLFLFLWYQ